MGKEKARPPALPLNASEEEKFMFSLGEWLRNEVDPVMEEHERLRSDSRGAADIRFK